MHRRNFIQQSGSLLAGTVLAGNAIANDSFLPVAKTCVAMVGTGVRGLGMWGKPVLEEFGEVVEFVGLCDINPGRYKRAKISRRKTATLTRF